MTSKSDKTEGRKLTLVVDEQKNPSDGSGDFVSTGPVTPEMVAKAIDALDWTWLRDKRGIYQVNMGADAEHGNLETHYAFSVRPEWDNSIVLRLYAVPWFAGIPEEVRNACEDWNRSGPYPKAALLRDDDGDSKLVLEWLVPCWDEAIAQSLVNRWLEEFARCCAGFLQRFNDELQAAPRYVSSPSSPSIH